MSTRSSTRKKIPTTRLSADETPRSRKAKQPKLADDGDGLSSRGSSPGSRPVTPATSRSKRGVGKSSTVGRPKKRGASGANTPVSRQSRASSVSSTAKTAATGRKPGRKSKAGSKSKSSSASASFKETDYHYGSDFEGNMYDDDNESDNSSDSDLSDMDSLSDDMKPESDVELEPNLLDEEDLPDWLEDPTNLPKLELPETSDDLLLLPDQAFEAITVYEVLRQYYKILRLSPFRFEDFCAMLAATQDQSNLISEIHISLLKALLREDEGQQAQYGPLDQKDSMNVFVNFIDSVTWPENLRFYLNTDPEVYKEGLQIVNNCEYPFTNVEDRIKVLRMLTNALLSTSAVRDDLLNEGALAPEDHCRVCHKLGDMVICEHCNGPFHGTCLEPPMFEVPEEDWICPVCVEHMIDGVYDCLSTIPGSCRIQQLGTDRHGARYWFASRRIWVSMEGVSGEDVSGEGEGVEPKYYSTRAQLIELIETIDKEKYEKDLYEGILDIQEEMEKQMDVTEALTKKLNSKGLKSYLDTNNMVLDKLHQERNDLKEFLEAEKLKVQMDIDRQIREEEEERTKQIKEKERKEKEEKLAQLRKDKEEKEAQLRKEREERLKRRTGEDGDIKVEDDTVKEETVENMEVDQEIQALEAEIKEEDIKVENEVVTAADLPQVESYKGPRDMKEIKRGTMPPGPYYRLGEEYTYLAYSNQYSIHLHALSKSQSKEEGEKKSKLSHKFSLTDVSTFKWTGQVQGQRNTIVATIRNTILALENNIPQAFMHTNWPLLRKPWIQAVSTCINANKDFSRALTVFTCCIKPCILLPVWTDSLGHTSIKKVGYQGKEEKKRQEKREKKEREDEEERLKPFMAWVKYTLPVRSLSVVRQKGEEYRAHGRNGWLWLSSTRSYRPRPSAQLGMRAGPYRIAANYTEIKSGISKVVLMEPKALAFLLKVQKERDESKIESTKEAETNGTDASKDNNEKVIEVEKQEEEKNKVNLTKVLDVSRIDLMEPTLKDLGGEDGVINVSEGISHPTRILFPRCAKKTKIDELLGRRLHLKSVEERKLDPLSCKEEPAPSLSLEKWIEECHSKLNAQVDAITSLQSGQLSCYSPLCRVRSLPADACYSPSCYKHKQITILATAADLYNRIMAESKERQVKNLPSTTTEVKFTYTTTALSALNHLISLLKAKEEEVNYESALQSLSTSTKDTKSESVLKKVNDIKTESGDGEDKTSDIVEIKQENKRIYSDTDTSKPIKLEKLHMFEKKQSRIVKYPLAPTFWSKIHNKRNILINSKHELKRLARQAGMVTSEGFNYNSKANQSAWPYPCPRPTFKITWMYRTASMQSLHSVALQLRILWACIRWDDLHAKYNPEAKTSVTTDTEIVTTEILKHRNIGRFLELTQYFQRRVTIPLDAPRKQVDYSPIRSGLRKRKRAESPVQAEPQVEEKWIDESEFELSEIRAYRNKLENEKSVAVTRTNNGRSIKAPERYDPSDDHEVKRRSTASSHEMRAKFDAQIKEQREAFKASRSTTPDLPSAKPSLSGIKRENSIRMSTNQTTSYTTSIPGSGGAKKVFLTKDGKILGHQIIGGTVPNKKVAIPNINKTTVSTTLAPQQPQVTTQPSPSSQQKVQIVKTADGKIQVRGLMPGQQLVQMPDGKLQIFSLPAGQTAQSPGGGIKLASSTGVKPASPQTLASQPQIQATPGVGLGLPRPTMLPNATSSPIQAMRPQTVPLMRPTTVAGVTPIQPKPGTVGLVPMSGGVVTAPGGPRLQLMQTANGTVTPVQGLRPSLPTAPLAANNTPGVIQSTGSITTPTTANITSPNKGSTLVGIQSLGQNTITVNNGQLIVQGPDHEAATNIARQLASGQAKLANIGGKQVLLITNPNQQAGGIATVPSSTAVQQQSIMSPQKLQSQTLPQQQQFVQQPQLVQQQHQQPQLVQQQLVQKQPQLVQQQQTQLVPQQQPQLVQQQPQLVQQQPQLVQQQPQLVQQHQQQISQQTVTVSANLIQTEQGPRIILQGLQGVALSQEQLTNIQQQVKAQLLKQQALARQQQKVPPTKVSLELIVSSGQPMIKPQTPGGTPTPLMSTHSIAGVQPAPMGVQPVPVGVQPVPVGVQPVPVGVQQPIQTTTPTITSLPGSTVPTPTMHQETLADGRAAEAAAASRLAAPVRQQPPPAPQPVPMNTLPDHILKQGKYITKDGKRMLILPQHVMQQYQQSLKQQQQQNQLSLKQQQNQQQLTTTPSAQNIGDTKLMSPTGANKLFSPSKMEDDKFELTDDYIQQTIKEALESGNLTPDLQEKLMSQLNEQDDTNKAKSRGNSGRKPKKKSDAFDPETGERMDDEWEPQSWGTKAKINNQIKEMKETSHKEKVSAVASIPGGQDYSPPQVVVKQPTASSTSAMKQQQQHKQLTQDQHPNTTQQQQKKKFTNYTATRLNAMLFKNKEQLKKDIAKKRSVLEKDLMHEIQRDIESLKKQAALKLGSEHTTAKIMTSSTRQQQHQDNSNSSANINSKTDHEGSRKRKADASPALPPAVGKMAGVQPPRKKAKGEKNERLYCLCKSKYDPTKFYVGCDICSNWFHGACVGITQKMSKKMNEYVCDECMEAKEGTEVYCMCKQPYDEARFYIGCERCPDWLHGRCVGILQAEAEGIQDYECPKCNPKSAMNLANLKKVKGQDLDIMKKLFKQIQGSKHSAPFKKPLDRRTNKKYFDLVKEPMDLETMDKKLEREEYKTLAEFLGDLTRITENCRYFYPPESGNSKHAEGLELTILDKLGTIRQKFLENK